MPRRFRRAAATAALLLLIGACDGRATTDGPAVRDSAGVTIVENPAPDATLPEWRLIPEPVVSLGALDAGPEYELYQPLHALRLDDGRIVVANQGTEEIRFYDATGRHLHTAGRKGGGPGEFEGLWGLLRLPGDSLGAWDWTARRLTILDDSGRLGRVVTPGADLGFVPRLLGAFDDGSIAIARGPNPGAIAQQGGAARDDSLTLLRLGLPDGALLDSLGPYPDDERYLHMGDGGFWMMQIPFGRRERVEIAAGMIHVGDDRTGEIRSYEADGGLIRIIRLAHEPRPVTEDLLARERERQLANVQPELLQRLRERLDRVPAAESLPAFTDLFVDRLGRAWIEQYDDDPAAPGRWVVTAPDGRLLARIELPHRARPLDAGPGYLLAYEQDDLDIEYVRLYRIEPLEDSA